MNNTFEPTATISLNRYTELLQAEQNLNTIISDRKSIFLKRINYSWQGYQDEIITLEPNEAIDKIKQEISMLKKENEAILSTKLPLISFNKRVRDIV